MHVVKYEKTKFIISNYASLVRMERAEKSAQRHQAMEVYVDEELNSPPTRRRRIANDRDGFVQDEFEEEASNEPNERNSGQPPKVQLNNIAHMPLRIPEGGSGRPALKNLTNLPLKSRTNRGVHDAARMHHAAQGEGIPPVPHDILLAAFLADQRRERDVIRRQQDAIRGGTGLFLTTNNPTNEYNNLNNPTPLQKDTVDSSHINNNDGTASSSRFSPSDDDMCANDTNIVSFDQTKSIINIEEIEIRKNQRMQISKFLCSFENKNFNSEAAKSKDREHTSAEQSGLFHLEGPAPGLISGFHPKAVLSAPFSLGQCVSWRHCNQI